MAVAAAFATLAFAQQGPPAYGATPERASVSHPRAAWTAAHQTVRANGAADETDIPPDQVAKYIAVYTAMQRNHSLTVEQAAAQQGFTMSTFRQLENRVERNPAVQDRVKRALRAAAKARTPAARPTAKTK